MSEATSNTSDAMAQEQPGQPETATKPAEIADPYTPEELIRRMNHAAGVLADFSEILDDAKAEEIECLWDFTGALRSSNAAKLRAVIREFIDKEKEAA